MPDFLTHTVQMKLWAWGDIVVDYSVSFLTHTVQMKQEDWFSYVESLYKLLNPHGSDETLMLLQRYTSPSRLLNPHGSDETKG